MKILTDKEKREYRGVEVLVRRFYRNKRNWDHRIAVVEYRRSSLTEMFNVSIYPKKDLLKDKKIDGLSIPDEAFIRRDPRIRSFLSEYITDEELASRIYKFLLRDLDRLGWLDGSL